MDAISKTRESVNEMFSCSIEVIWGHSKTRKGWGWVFVRTTGIGSSLSQMVKSRRGQTRGLYTFLEHSPLPAFLEEHPCFQSILSIALGGFMKRY